MRAQWEAPLNRLTVARNERLQRGDEILDLTASNPTTAGIPYPLDELAAAISGGARAQYDPQPLGIASARQAVAAQERCDPEDIVITASTSEAYSFLFKLLTNPGDEVAIAVPSYPLLEHLAAMELVALLPFPLELHRRWEIGDPHLTARTRAIAIVSPNNPTGSFVQADEMGRLAGCGLPLIIDEVFRDYPLDGGAPGQAPERVLSFSMNGLSKSAGLPHFKLGWIRVRGPLKERRAAIAALEMIADNFLSVATPVQVALPELLRIGATIRASILERVRANLTLLRNLMATEKSITVLPAEGGWSTVLRVPATMPDEELALQLLARGVAVHPGYFFDFAADGFLVVSLLTPPHVLSEGARRLLEVIRG